MVGGIKYEPSCDITYSWWTDNKEVLDELMIALGMVGTGTTMINWKGLVR